MGLHAFLISLPAIIALLFKVGIFAYARLSATHNRQTQLFLVFLLALSLQNLAEIHGFHTLIDQNSVPYFAATTYYAASIIVIALVFHLALALAFDSHTAAWRKLALLAVYVYAAALEVLLIFTPWLISDFVPFEYTVSRVPGSAYFAFEFYATGVFLAVIGTLVYGGMYQNSAQKRARISIFLVALIPMALVVFAVLTLLHLGVKWFNATVVFPMAITYFLVVTAYAIHHHRLFDIQFYIPWSKVRKRKTAFYERIRAMVAEIADLESVDIAIRRLADTLGCAVALRGSHGAVIAQAGVAAPMLRLPESALHTVEHTVVANEIADSRPQTHALLKRHNIAAVVPFYPHSRYASGWLLLSDAFSQHVYTPLDFRLVEQLFDRMAELFIDRLLSMRAQLADAHSQIRELTRRVGEAEAQRVPLQRELAVLRAEHARLLREQPVDSLRDLATEARDALGATITLVGRDATLLTRLRKRFPQVARFAGAQSAAFQRQGLPEVLLWRLDKDPGTAGHKLLTRLGERRTATGVLTYGKAAAEFTTKHRDRLRGFLVEALPEELSEAVLTRKIGALAALRRAVHVLNDPDFPLIGRSQALAELLTAARRMAGFRESAVIKTEEVGCAIALAAYLHELGHRRGRLLHKSAEEVTAMIANEPELMQSLQQVRAGTLLIERFCALATTSRNKLLEALRVTDQVRLLAHCSAECAQTRDGEQGCDAVSNFVLEIPRLRERKEDIPLYLHYYSLQYNLQAGTQHYLSETESEDLLADGLGLATDLSALKRTVFARLQAKPPTSREPPSPHTWTDGVKSLDDHVSGFEATLIAQTLERCGGNKSKTARLLGLRPNTLHYKLERYGLLANKRS